MPDGQTARDSAVRRLCFSAEVDRTRGGNLHDRIVVRLGLAAKLIHAFRIVSFGRKREDVTRLCEEKPVQNGLAQLIRFLLQGIVLNTAGGQEESGDYQQGGPGDHMQDRGIRKAGNTAEAGKAADQGQQDRDQKDCLRGNERKRGTDAGHTEGNGAGNVGNGDHAPCGSEPEQYAGTAGGCRGDGGHTLQGCQFEQHDSDQDGYDDCRPDERRFKDSQDGKNKACREQNRKKGMGQAGANGFLHGMSSFR